MTELHGFSKVYQVYAFQKKFYNCLFSVHWLYNNKESIVKLQ